MNSSTGDFKDTAGSVVPGVQLKGLFDITSQYG